ncbi:cation:proton antiporter [Maritimibacter sp. 55A14]|uniref:cation:proton antiporter n=1 Tax=Maritimibacter sp. 55A14 TaxID=2174844 RepID=UPI001304937A|nr:cation:proton antiporter [Maritimibacter sp. 55A14]
MSDLVPGHAPVLLVMGLVALVAVPLRALFQRLGLPPMIGFIALGVALSLAGSAWGVLDAELARSIRFLAEIGIVVLLFRIGLESNLDALLGQLGRAALIWLPNMGLAALAAFLLVWFWPGLGLLPALYAAVAASATSIGVSIAVWDDAGALDSPSGALLLDVAELDDISAVVLLGVLFAVAPLLGQAGNGDLFMRALAAGGWQLLLLMVFCAACYLFSRWLEKPVSDAFARLSPGLGPIVFAAGAVFVIAGCAGFLGFSVAIGALFAGLAFSRDPAEHSIDDAFAVLLALFGPFFFVAIGLSVDAGLLGGALGLAAALSAAAVLGKLAGAGLPAAWLLDRREGWLIGASMVPRAEIFLLVMLHGLTLGPFAVPQTLYNAAVLTSLATCLLGPLIVERALRRRGNARSAR